MPPVIFGQTLYIAKYRKIDLDEKTSTYKKIHHYINIHNGARSEESFDRGCEIYQGHDIVRCRSLRTIEQLRHMDTDFREYILTNGCDLSLMSEKDEKQIDQSILTKSQKDGIPILIQKGNEYLIYGDSKGDGNWKFTKITSDISHLKDLPFENRILRRSEEKFTTSLINTLKEGHTLTNYNNEEKITEFLSALIRVRGFEIHKNVSMDVRGVPFINEIEQPETKIRMDIIAAVRKKEEKSVLSLCKHGLNFSVRPTKYDLCLMSDEIKEIEKGKLYIAWAENSLRYTVIDPSGITITDTITENELSPVNSELLTVVKKTFSLEKLRPFISDILEVTSKRGHTWSTSWEQNWIISIEHQGHNAYDLVLMSDEIKLEEGSLYVKKISENAFEYTLVNPFGKKVTGIIKQEEFKHDIPEPFTKDKLTPFLTDILQITSERGHTCLNIKIPVRTPLCAAAAYCDHGMMKLLLKNHADINYRLGYYDVSPIICAIAAGKYDNLKYLLEYHKPQIMKHGICYPVDPFHYFWNYTSEEYIYTLELAAVVVAAGRADIRMLNLLIDHHILLVENAVYSACKFIIKYSPFIITELDRIEITIECLLQVLENSDRKNIELRKRVNKETSLDAFIKSIGLENVRLFFSFKDKNYNQLCWEFLKKPKNLMIWLNNIVTIADINFKEEILKFIFGKINEVISDKFQEYFDPLILIYNHASDDIKKQILSLMLSHKCNKFIMDKITNNHEQSSYVIDLLNQKLGDKKEVLQYYELIEDVFEKQCSTLEKRKRLIISLVERERSEMKSNESAKLLNLAAKNLTLNDAIKSKSAPVTKYILDHNKEFQLDSDSIKRVFDDVWKQEDYQILPIFIEYFSKDNEIVFRTKKHPFCILDDPNGDTIAHEAIRAQKYKLIKMLPAESLIKFRNKFNESALDVAIEQNNIIAILIISSMKISSIMNDIGYSSRIFLSICKFKPLVKKEIDYRIDGLELKDAFPEIMERFDIINKCIKEIKPLKNSIFLCSPNDKDTAFKFLKQKFTHNFLNNKPIREIIKSWEEMKIGDRIVKEYIYSRRTKLFSPDRNKCYEQSESKMLINKILSEVKNTQQESKDQLMSLDEDESYSSEATIS